MSSKSANFLRDKKKAEREALHDAAMGGSRSTAETRIARQVLVSQTLLNGVENGDDDDDDDDDEEQQAGPDAFLGQGNFSLDTFEDCVEATEAAMAQSELGAALIAAQAALPLASTPEELAVAHDNLGLVLMEDVSRVAEACEHFSAAEAQAPGTSYERCLNMAQLTDGADSLRFYQMGLEIAQNALAELPAARKGEDEEVTEERAHLKHVSSQAMTSMADLYLTELCDEDVAESECERLLKGAIQAAPGNAEAFRSYASLHMIKGDAEKSITFILHAHKLLMKQAEDKKEPLEFMSRVGIAELLIKLEQWPQAAELINMLLDEDDRIAELWSHAGVAHANLALMLAEPEQTREYQYAAAQYFISALRLLKQAPDEELDAAVQNQLRALEDAGVDLEVVKQTMSAQEAAAVDATGTLSDVESDADEEEGGQAMG
jgi:hypothetical protein